MRLAEEELVKIMHAYSVRWGEDETYRKLEEALRRVRETLVEWGTNVWGDILSEPTEAHARDVVDRFKTCKLYKRVPNGKWEEAE